FYCIQFLAAVFQKLHSFFIIAERVLQRSFTVFKFLRQRVKLCENFIQGFFLIVLRSFFLYICHLSRFSFLHPVTSASITPSVTAISRRSPACTPAILVTALPLASVTKEYPWFSLPRGDRPLNRSRYMPRVCLYACILPSMAFLSASSSLTSVSRLSLRRLCGLKYWKRVWYCASLALPRDIFPETPLSRRSRYARRFSSIPAKSATASSAAAEGVGALKSATKSAMVKSVSCP